MALVLVERGLQAGSPADLAQAEAIAAEVLPAARGAGETVTLAWAAGALGRVALERGDVGRAARLVGEGLEVLWSSRLRAVWPWLLPYLAEVAVATGDLALAGEVVGFLLHDPGVPAWVRGKARDLEARLGGGPVFAEAARAGAALPPDEVAARTRALADRAGPA